jgi:hypothetical protein
MHTDAEMKTLQEGNIMKQRPRMTLITDSKRPTRNQKRKAGYQTEKHEELSRFQLPRRKRRSAEMLSC